MNLEGFEEETFQEVRAINKYYKFKAYMSEQGIIQADVAKLIAVSNATLNKKINGTGSDFSLTQVRIICSHYNIDANDFFINNLVSNTR